MQALLVVKIKVEEVGVEDRAAAVVVQAAAVVVRVAAKEVVPVARPVAGHPAH